MSCKIISYDLDKPNRNYEELSKAIKKLGSWRNCLDSVWIVDTSLTSSTVRDKLSNHIDPGDKLVVFKLSGAWTTHNLSSDCNTGYASTFNK